MKIAKSIGNMYASQTLLVRKCLSNKRLHVVRSSDRLKNDARDLTENPIDKAY